jgi:hypothetical protein
MYRLALSAVAVSALAAALAAPAFAQAQKFSCIPNTMTACSAPGKCESQPATAQDKQELMVLDFAAKKVMIQKGANSNPFGNIENDRMEGDKRLFSVKPEGAPQGLEMELAGGVLTGKLDPNGSKFTADCTAAQ